MLSEADWIRLINGLLVATNSGRIRWEEVNMKESAASLLFAVDAVYGGRQLTAVHNQTRYELSGREGGRPPFELRIIEPSAEGGPRTVDKVKSSASATSNGWYEVNAALDRLFDSASAGVESGGQ
ncbi:hypothetical protein, partial [Microbacterium sp. Bi128]|uniref:hypothetical protein n=1 Tax=Microbacterium sp. Bi128 TaxID=2821115 RepID=UPI001E377A14